MIKVLPTDHMDIYPTVKQMADGSLCIRFEGGMFRTQLGIRADMGETWMFPCFCHCRSGGTSPVVAGFATSQC
jgi:hypothetical protein